jgi:hypothetical protein
MMNLSFKTLLLYEFLLGAGGSRLEIGCLKGSRENLEGTVDAET